jgi:hypothetical protein
VRECECVVGKVRWEGGGEGSEQDSIHTFYSSVNLPIRVYVHHFAREKNKRSKLSPELQWVCKQVSTLLDDSTVKTVAVTGACMCVCVCVCVCVCMCVCVCVSVCIFVIRLRV